MSALVVSFEVKWTESAIRRFICTVQTAPRLRSWNLQILAEQTTLTPKYLRTNPTTNFGPFLNITFTPHTYHMFFISELVQVQYLQGIRGYPADRFDSLNQSVHIYFQRTKLATLHDPYNRKWVVKLNSNKWSRHLHQGAPWEGREYNYRSSFNKAVSAANIMCI